MAGDEVNARYPPRSTRVPHQQLTTASGNADHPPERNTINGLATGTGAPFAQATIAPAGRGIPTVSAQSITRKRKAAQ